MAGELCQRAVDREPGAGVLEPRGRLRPRGGRHPVDERHGVRKLAVLEGVFRAGDQCRQAVSRDAAPRAPDDDQRTDARPHAVEPVAFARHHRLRRLGVRIAIDDFGTGYSSLSYLAHLPVDALKLDRSFVSSLGRDERTDSIVRAIMMLAHGLAIDVVAEGIETRQQQDLLRRYGYSRGQGFLYAPPLTKEDAARALDTGNLAPQPAYAAA